MSTGPELETEVEKLRAVLKPFAEYGSALIGQRVDPDSSLIELWGHKITVKDLRSAAEVYWPRQR